MATFAVECDGGVGQTGVGGGVGVLQVKQGRTPLCNVSSSLFVMLVPLSIQTSKPNIIISIQMQYLGCT